MGVNDNANQMRRNGGGDDIRPRPDPTSLTSDLVEKAIAALREVLEARITGNRDLTLARFDEMDKAVLLLQSGQNRQPTETDIKITALHTLILAKMETIDQQLKGVDKQFQDRDSRVEQTARDSKLAIDAALQAAEKAVSKSELSTLKQIDGQAEFIRATSKNSDDKIDDLKQRVTRIESLAVGRVSAVQEGHSSSSDSRGQLTMFISAGLAVLGVITFILAQMKP